MAFQDLFISGFVYLLAAVISVAVIKRLGLSTVLGYLIAGVIIGPFCLGFVGNEGADVMSFAEFGVIMMLFLVGLEVQPAILWRLRGPIVGIGGGQVIGTVVVVAGIGVALGLPWQSALGIGMAISLSSTAIVLQSLQERGESQTTGGRTAFSVLLSQDIAVIPMLSLMPLLAVVEPSLLEAPSEGGGSAVEATGFQAWLASQPAWVNTLMVLIAVGLIILAGRTILRPCMRAVARTGVREAFVALALVLVVGIALLMTTLGVSAALGTFLAGVVLADSEYRHELEADIEPFKGLLLGVFFIAVGASIDFNLIFDQPLIVAAIVLGIIVVKAAVMFAVGFVSRLQTDQNLLVSFSLAQGSEFAFVVLGFGLAAGVFVDEVAQLMVACVALTMAMAPLVMIFELKVLRPRIGTRMQESRPADAMAEDAPVILAGVGRFGNYIARMLIAQGIPVTVIDSDSEHVEFLRKAEIKTFYGDVTRYDLLEAAGARRAKLLIIAIDREEETDKVIDAVRKHFPHLKILVRALSRDHLYDLLDAQVDVALHQHEGSAINLAEAALRELGFRGHRASRIARTFRHHDDISVREALAFRQEEGAYLKGIRSRMSDLKDRFREGDPSLQKEADKSWDASRLRDDTASEDYSDIVPKKADDSK